MKPEISCSVSLSLQGKGRAEELHSLALLLSISLSFPNPPAPPLRRTLSEPGETKGSSLIFSVMDKVGERGSLLEEVRWASLFTLSHRGRGQGEGDSASPHS